MMSYLCEAEFLFIVMIIIEYGVNLILEQEMKVLISGITGYIVSNNL